MDPVEIKDDPDNFRNGFVCGAIGGVIVGIFMFLIADLVLTGCERVVMEEDPLSDVERQREVNRILLDRNDKVREEMRQLKKELDQKYDNLVWHKDISNRDYRELSNRLKEIEQALKSFNEE